MNHYPLIIENVTKTFADGNSSIKIIDNLSFKAKKGEIAAIVGPSGSGKSTFLSIAGALMTPDNGEVRVEGKNIVPYTDINKANIRLNHIGYIFQTSNLVPYLKVEEQLHIVLKMAGKWNKETKSYAESLLKTVGMENHAKHYPHQLSGGEKQRVAIARAFVNNPEIILADEPTASLDSKRSWSVMHMISKIVKEHNKAAIIVTHDEQILPICDLVYQMNDGQLSVQKHKRSESI
jgi:putative ABC transport system ATP-binding protein